MHPFELPDDVVFHLLRVSSIVTLVGFRAIDRLAARYVGDELSRRYRNLLHPFVSDDLRFRSMLDHHCAVIAGSGALAVCLHGSLTPNDLDVYVPRDALASVVAYLVNSESYVVSRFLDPASTGTYQGGIDRVICLRRGCVSIDIVLSHTDCATLPIPHFWSTASMVYVSGNSFCVPYPALLRDRRALLNPARIAVAGAVADLSPLIRKYRSLGFDFYLNEADWRRTSEPGWVCPRGRSPTCPITVRWFGDRFCLEGLVEPRERPYVQGIRENGDTTLTTVWWRGGVACGETCRTGEHGLVSGVWTHLRQHLE